MVPFIDEVTVNTTTYKAQEAKAAFVKLLKHEFEKAEIENLDVYKGEVKFKMEDELSVRSTPDPNFDMVMQIILPSDLYYLYLALGTLGVEAFQLTTQIKDKLNNLYTANTLDRINTITNLAKDLLAKEEVLNFIKLWMARVIEEKQTALLNSINFYLGRRKKQVSQVSKEIDDVLNKYKENPQDYSIFRFLMNNRYTPRLGNFGLKVRNPLYVLALLIMCSKQQMILYHDNAQLIPDIDTVKVSRFIDVPAKTIIVLGVMNLNPSITLLYPMM